MVLFIVFPEVYSSTSELLIGVCPPVTTDSILAMS